MHHTDCKPRPTAHRQWTAYNGPWTVGTPNGPTSKKFKIAIDMARTKNTKNDPEWAQRPFLRPHRQGKWGKDPSLELWKEKDDDDEGKKEPKVHLSHSYEV
ncbi:hypothetical protein O181_084453 [Austropuccinia psidii MF-1]|uniref:Uncharacterized protein n=1 Tax=Austropuccinia psidii MF-1 TaxID=1389203 RepID=A0A9Q3FVN6_9BASI|nr:hypothetical protein [Austropuccinia psidii MF-1]